MVSAEHGLRALFLDGMPSVLIGLIVVYATVDTLSNSTFVLANGGAQIILLRGGGVAFLFCFCFDPGYHSVVGWSRTHCVAQASFN